MPNNLNILYLVGAFFVIFFLVNQIISKKRYKVQDLFNENYKEENKKRKEANKKKGNLLTNSKWGRYFSSGLFVKEAQRYEWSITIKDYWMYVLVGGATISIVISFFQLGSLSVLGFIGGFALPRMLLIVQKMRYQKLVEDKIIIYMKSLSNAMSVHGNIAEAVESILPLLGNPIKKDVETSLAVLRAGESATTAFESLNEKYRYSDLVFFHNMLGAAQESGGEFQKILTTAADEFEHKKVLQAKLRANMTQANKSFRQNVIFVFGMLAVFKFGAKDLYNQFFTTAIGKAIIILIISTVIYSALMVYRHNQFDPTDAERKG